MSKLIFFSSVLIICTIFTGCGGEPYTYESYRDLKPGPGILSGDDGEFTLIGSSQPKEEKLEEETSE